MKQLSDHLWLQAVEGNPQVTPKLSAENTPEKKSGGPTAKKKADHSSKSGKAKDSKVRV